MGLLVLEQAYGRTGGVGEGLVDAGDLVDPELEDGGDAEVVHGDAEDELVGGKELCDEGVGEGDAVVLGRGAAFFRGVDGSDPGGVDGGEVAGIEVAGDDLAVGVGGFPVLDELAGEVA